jgi:hypothetical protein
MGLPCPPCWRNLWKTRERIVNLNVDKQPQMSPRITARRGGGVTKKMARSLLIDAAGEVFLVPSIGTPPRPRESGRGGEFAFLKMAQLGQLCLKGGENSWFEFNHTF